MKYIGAQHLCEVHRGITKGKGQGQRDKGTGTEGQGQRSKDRDGYRDRKLSSQEGMKVEPSFCLKDSN